MKRFFIFLVVAIAVVSLGLSIYYFSADNEVIYIKSSCLIINKDDTISTLEDNNDLIEFKNRDEKTTIVYSCEDDGVLSYNKNECFFTAIKGGKSTITISTSNRNYSRLLIDVLVCDGTEQYPYYIKTVTQLKSIGKNSVQLKELWDTTDEKADELARIYSNENCFKLGNSIELSKSECWTPINNYYGVFDGNFYTIKNLTIDSTLSNETVNNIGFIGNLKAGACVKNLYLDNIDINISATNIGAIAGLNNGLIQTSEITNSIIKSNFQGYGYVGGIAGYCDSTTNFRSKIDRCGFEGTIVLSGSNNLYGGGISGKNESGIISESYFRGIIKNSTSKFGGIVGENIGENTNSEESQLKSADVYDCYFYMKDKDNSTNTSYISGVIYKNDEPSSSNEFNYIMGNYFGGDFTSTEISSNSYKFTTNSYLSIDDFKNQKKFITSRTLGDSNKTRYWNFETVWSLPNDVSYPILNIKSSTGSAYIIDVPDVVTSNYISNAQELYNALSTTSNTTYQIIDNIDCSVFVWGEGSHPIPQKFLGTILNPDGYKIKDITIYNGTSGANVGLVREMSQFSKLSGIKIETVNINGKDGNYVGVLAGLDYGSVVYNTSISDVHVNISGNSLGAVFGKTNKCEGHGLSIIKVQGLYAQNEYFVSAGGFVGINLTNISSDTNTYNQSSDIYVVANYMGGITGANGGNIYYVSTNNVKFNQMESSLTNENMQKLYDDSTNKYDVVLGGVVGLNSFYVDSKKYTGSISWAYSNVDFLMQTTAKKVLHIGGVVGRNEGKINKSYTKSSKIKTQGSHTCYVGGVAGYNYLGKITSCLVDENTIIETGTNSSNMNKTNTIFLENCSMVGGICGYDFGYGSNASSVEGCANYSKSLKGFFVGGIVGISKGSMWYCYCGKATKAVNITGFMSGGICALVDDGGIVSDCYTFASITSSSGGTYTNIQSVTSLTVSSKAGIAVLALHGSQIQCSYAVVSFSGEGVSFGGVGSKDSNSNAIYCIYQNSGSKGCYGTKVAYSDMVGGGNSFREFRKNIYNTDKWTFNQGSYPTLTDVNADLPISKDFE